MIGSLVEVTHKPEVQIFCRICEKPMGVVRVTSGIMRGADPMLYHRNERVVALELKCFCQTDLRDPRSDMSVRTGQLSRMLGMLQDKDGKLYV